MCRGMLGKEVFSRCASAVAAYFGSCLTMRRREQSVTEKTPVASLAVTPCRRGITQPGMLVGASFASWNRWKQLSHGSRANQVLVSLPQRWRPFCAGTSAQSLLPSNVVSISYPVEKARRDTTRPARPNRRIRTSLLSPITIARRKHAVVSPTRCLGNAQTR